MEKTYWLGRRSSAVAMARIATSSKARLIHYDLAGRYSIMAASCPPFMLTTPAGTEAEGIALHIPPPGDEPPHDWAPSATPARPPLGEPS